MRVIGLSMIALASLATLAYGWGGKQNMMFGRQMGMNKGMNTGGYGYGGASMVQPIFVAAGHKGGASGIGGQGGIFSLLIFLFVFTILMRVLFNDNDNMGDRYGNNDHDHDDYARHPPWWYFRHRTAPRARAAAAQPLVVMVQPPPAAPAPAVPAPAAAVVAG